MYYLCKTAKCHVLAYYATDEWQSTCFSCPQRRIRHGSVSKLFPGYRVCSSTLRHVEMRLSNMTLLVFFMGKLSQRHYPSKLFSVRLRTLCYKATVNEPRPPPPQHTRSLSSPSDAQKHSRELCPLHSAIPTLLLYLLSTIRKHFTALERFKYGDTTRLNTARGVNSLQSLRAKSECCNISWSVGQFGYWHSS